MTLTCTFLPFLQTKSNLKFDTTIIPHRHMRRILEKQDVTLHKST